MSKKPKTIYDDDDILEDVVTNHFSDLVQPAVQPEQQHDKEAPTTDEDELVRRTRQISSLIYEDQVRWLDDTILAIKHGGWRDANKANIIRAILDTVESSGIDLTGVTSEDDIKARITTYL